MSDQADTTKEPVAAAAEKPNKPLTLKQRMEGLLKDKATLAAARDEANTRADEAEANVLAAESERDTALARAEAAEQRAAQLQSEIDAANARVDEMESAAKTVEEQATEQVASAGFPANQLPAASDKAAGDSRAELEARLKGETDPKEAFRIAQKLSPLSRN